MRRAALLGVVIFGVAACGGGGGRLSKQEFVSKANAICTKYNAKQKQVANPQSLADLSPALRKLLPIAKGQLQELEKLKPPKADDATWKSLLANARKENEFAEKRLLPAADKKDVAKIRPMIVQLQQMDQQNNATARALGLTTCART